MKTFLLALALFVSVKAHADAKGIDLLWKARALQAREKIIANLKKMPAEKMAGQMKCEHSLEAAYSIGADPKFAETLGTIKPNFYLRRMLLPAPNADDAILVEFKYSTPADKLQGIMFSNLNPKWSFVSDFDGLEIAATSDCLFAFDRTNALNIVTKVNTN